MTAHGRQGDIAIGFAHAAHHGQYDRDGELHIRHVQRVVIGVNKRRTTPEAGPNGGHYTFLRLGGASDEVQAVAWLHDVIEDSHVQPEYLRAAGFGPLVIQAVRLVTRPMDGTTYPEYVVSIAEAEGIAGEIARLVKLADLEDNLRRSELEGSLSTVRRYARALGYLTNAMGALGEQM